MVSDDIGAALRRLVTARARERCEYCGLAQAGQEATFHIDHIVPRASKGPTAADNLALACVSCSLRKEARRSALDPQLFGPSPFSTLADNAGSITSDGMA